MNTYNLLFGNGIYLHNRNNSRIRSILQMSWEQIRKEYKEINRTQLKYVLTNYHLGTNKRIPFDWNPPLLERLSSAEEESLTESFSNHPPLVLPGDGFILNLSPETMDDAFCVTLKEVIDLLGKNAKKNDRTRRRCQNLDHYVTCHFPRVGNIYQCGHLFYYLYGTSNG